nr:TOBE domain-containing protein [Rhizobium leguminosarum]
MGEVNFIPGTVKAADSVSASVETPLGSIVLARRNFTAGSPQEKQRVTLCIRPEHFRRGSEATEPVTTLGEAVTVGSAFFGTHYRCHLTSARMANIAIVAHMPQSAGVAEGQSIALAVDAADVIALPEHGVGS